MNEIRALTARTLAPKLRVAAPSSLLSSRKAYSTSVARPWEPFRSIYEQWTEVKGEPCWVEVLVPRDPRLRMQNRVAKMQQDNSKVVFGVRCNRRPPTIIREMAEDFRRRTMRMYYRD